jgi:hypothetical protein
LLRMMGSARSALCRRSPTAGDIRHDSGPIQELGRGFDGRPQVSRGALEPVTPFLTHRPETPGSGRVPLVVLPDAVYASPGAQGSTPQPRRGAHHASSPAPRRVGAVGLCLALLATVAAAPAASAPAQRPWMDASRTPRDRAGCCWRG